MRNYPDLDKLMPALRKEYHWGKLNEKDLHRDPMEQFARWFEEALRKKVRRPAAMTLATAGEKGFPSARTVLLKAFDRRGFVFYSDYESQKARELAQNPMAAIVFFWPEFERQVCITGKVEKVSKTESIRYFKSRPRDSQIAACVSHQSRFIQSRALLDRKFKEFKIRYRGKDIPRPKNWGGFRLAPRMIEFWQGRENRLNDRLRYRRLPTGRWKIERIQP
ncbi:MAG TPA: pyridoxamine 5'-phosphate oxidase [bacterium]|nr:pyridoxamine 5'-phosphate oxidase [bacterium]